VSCDGGVVPLPQRVVQAEAKYLTPALAALIAESRQPSYDALLGVLDRLAQLRTPRHFFSLRKLLAQGHSADDVVWAGEHHLLGLLLKSNLRPAQVRRVADQFAARGLPGSGHQRKGSVPPASRAPSRSPRPASRSARGPSSCPGE